ncbi:hypothetical protein PDJAM_G00151860 [Pangasius djambal]|uniref:Uncharacterized protein n=1 Tax=Pangasius djambal TaxID=1691987 RepID=A0ACC5ZJK8_9TELE|nr:hypothetical protein [Pangasius djambal]
MFSLVKLPPVFNVHQVPKAYQEDCIISGYRHPRSSATDCILSLFQLTNETLNVWTHFLPTWYFLYKLLTVVFIQDVWTDAYTWPLLVFLLSCCVYPLASSCAHTFSTMSTRSRHICYFFDYGALSLYSLGSAIAYSAYVVPDAWVNSAFHRCYVPAAVLNSVISTTMACYSRFGFPPHSNHNTVNRFAESKRARLGKVLRIFLCVGEGCTANEVNSLHVYHTLLAFLTGFLFATHLPERLAPGRFDLIGHSHQLFHVCGIIGTHFQMQAIQMDMTLRRPWLYVHAPAITFRWTLGATMLSIVISLSIICLFSYLLFHSPVQGKATRKGSGAAKKK